MVTNCANPSCLRPFRYLRGGKLFLVKTPPPDPIGDAEFREGSFRSEYFWLCERCARSMTITSDRVGRVAVSHTQTAMLNSWQLKHSGSDLP
jgi:hypothetical protein